MCNTAERLLELNIWIIWGSKNVVKQATKEATKGLKQATKEWTRSAVYFECSSYLILSLLLS